jgi:ubiquinone/menaquinone biosynthesis C-methylase UbiE
LRVKQRTAESFGYVWHRFSSPEAVRDVGTRHRFLERMRPYPAEFFRGQLVLDVGSGSGADSVQAAELGASVVAVDLSSAVDVTRRNVSDDVLTVQADAERLPFDRGVFDFVMSIGVLHHLPDPQRALCSIAPFARVGGHVHVYLYWTPRRRWHRALLTALGVIRALTSRLPNRLAHRLCYPAAALSWLMFVQPYRVLRRRSWTRRLADVLPLKAYADASFAGLVGALFDYLHTPIQMRFDVEQVRAMMAASGVADVQVIADNGWIAHGRRH